MDMNGTNDYAIVININTQKNWHQWQERYVWFLSSCEECGRRGEVNQMSTCNLTFNLARGTRDGGDEVNPMSTCGVSADISEMWRRTFPLDGSQLKCPELLTITSTDYNPYTAVTLDTGALKRKLQFLSSWNTHKNWCGLCGKR